MNVKCNECKAIIDYEDIPSNENNIDICPECGCEDNFLNECEHCGSFDDVEFQVNPYESDINGNYDEEWICSNCVKNLCDEC